MTDPLTPHREFQSDYVRIDGTSLQEELFGDGETSPEEMENLRGTFDSLVKDPYMPNEFGIRKRRFGRFHWVRGGQLIPLMGTTFVQSAELNRIAGGIHREFAPLEKLFQDSPFLSRLIECLANRIDGSSKEWEVNVHQFRVETHGAPASAAPEGIHRDGHDFVAIISINRENIEGGLNRIYDDQKKLLLETLLSQPLDTLLIYDRKTFHDITPFQARHDSVGYRDTLVIDFNAS